MNVGKKTTAMRRARGVLFYSVLMTGRASKGSGVEGAMTMADNAAKGNRPVVSSEGYAKLEEELNYYKLVKRKEIAEQIKVARSYGDLSENAEYDEAKNEQAKVEDHITQLENMLRTVVVVDHADQPNDKVGVGSRVKVRDKVNGFEAEYKIVGATEADPLDGLISNESPVGAALIGARLDDEVTFAVPDGMRTLKVLSITKD